MADAGERRAANATDRGDRDNGKRVGSPKAQREGVRHLVDHPVPCLATGRGVFEYIDPQGRVVPVHYYMPSTFVGLGVEPPAEGLEVEDEQLPDVVDPEEQLEDEADDESTATDAIDDGGTETADEEEELSYCNITEFAEGLYCSQDGSHSSARPGTGTEGGDQGGTDNRYVRERKKERKINEE